MWEPNDPRPGRTPNDEDVEGESAGDENDDHDLDPSEFGIDEDEPWRQRRRPRDPDEDTRHYPPRPRR